MKSLISSILSLTFLLNGAPFAAGAPATASESKFAPSAKDWKRADKLLKKMSVEAKVGQLIQIGVNARFANRDSAYYKELKRQVVENKIGGIIFFGAPIYETSILIDRMQNEATVPLLMALDAETGIGMRFADAVNFPWAMAVAATGEPDYARRIGVITGREARAMGVQHVYAPVLDVNNNADNPVINVRSFGEDPQDVARFGTAFINGVQSEKAIATAKHFPGHGDTAVDSHRGLPIIDHSLASLEKTELVPFRAAVKDGVASVMIAHIALPQIDNEVVMPLKNYRGGDAEAGAEIVDQKAFIPATLSKKIQTDLLRNDMGFKGLIVTDAMSMSGLTLYFEQGEAGVRAFLAGSDLLEKPSDPDAMIAGILAAVKSGRISQERLNDSVRRILAWKSAVGLFENKITNIDAMDKIVSGPESLALSDEVATKAITLVRNDANALPLDRSKKIVVLGLSNGFDGPETMASFASTLRSNGVRFSPYYLQENSLAEQTAAARLAASEADIIVVGLYGRVRSGAKNSVGVPENGAAIIRELLASGKQVIGISFGNPYVLGSFPEMKTYLVAYGDMSSLQRAAARSVLGTQPITGRLPISLPGLYPRGTGIQVSPR
ncbi:MAG TPA: glycoside hydrolase family 3 N-terminal domain-containing protein [Pyrinomonadaceae bacterium]|nr:glycoside hydrolase family 3 N-terminal domain-containing protein [Pyrinomonadaceae bacterium]